MEGTTRKYVTPSLESRGLAQHETRVKSLEPLEPNGPLPVLGAGDLGYGL